MLTLPVASPASSKMRRQEVYDGQCVAGLKSWTMVVRVINAAPTPMWEGGGRCVARGSNVDLHSFPLREEYGEVKVARVVVGEDDCGTRRGGHRFCVEPTCFSLEYN
ncbi:hypothetical protein NDU88_005993 [Pleurodeles waltl]|uniref:Uncharacterized protein n=1 Tax=Pleurodeles waltl TaxID=8319 RepID=A0AAV7LTL4_PLEWA|nr:hypothetical protein NDU88_005993 [Pleurodeles waltl]